MFLFVTVPKKQCSKQTSDVHKNVQKATRTATGVDLHRTWTQCNTRTYRTLSGDCCITTHPNLSHCCNLIPTLRIKLLC